MSNIETTEIKLKTTPTGGMEAAHSPYYRRLLSAGYKGYLQGSIGGAALYGTFGLAIGSLLCIAALPFIPVAAALAMVPAASALGLIKGASTFGHIGSMAAINAEGSDLSEQRRYLLDRYNDLPEGQEGDREAEAIRKELLARSTDAQRPPVFHWKTVAIGAIAGTAAVLAVAGLLSSGIFSAAVIAEVFGAKLGSLIAGLGAPTLTTIGAAAGALTGATIGIDRYYIRKWFDHTEGVIHGGSNKEMALTERGAQVARLKEAAKADEITRARQGGWPTPPAAIPPHYTKSAAAAVSPYKPTHTINTARRMGILEIQRAMDAPVV